MANVLLGVTGSVAAILTPTVFRQLRQAGHQVKVVATRAALYFFDPLELDALAGHRNREVLILDEDEWPGQAEGQRWQRGEPVLHIELRRWADLFLIAPLDANTLTKLAVGLCDNCLTCVWRAWDATRPVVLAPAMNTLMWEHRLTAQHLAQVAHVTHGLAPPSELVELEGLVAWINARCTKLQVVPPQSKRLACGDIGIGALAAPEEIARVVAELLAGS